MERRQDDIHATIAEAEEEIAVIKKSLSDFLLPDDDEKWMG